MYYPQIKHLRIKSQFKQEYVAYFLNISQPQYSKLENGFRKPNSSELSRLSELYRVPTDQLLSREPKEEYITRSVRRVNDDSSPKIIEELVQQNQHYMMQLAESTQRSEKLIERLASLLDHRA